MKKELTKTEWDKVYPLFGYLHGRVFISSLRKNSTLFDGDIVLQYLSFVVAELNVHHFYSPLNIEKIISGAMTVQDYEDLVLLPVSAASAAEVVRWPRETTRRKLKALEKLGLLTYVGKMNDPKSGYVLTAKYMQFFYESNKSVYDGFVTVYEQISKLQMNLN